MRMDYPRVCMLAAVGLMAALGACQDTAPGAGEPAAVAMPIDAAAPIAAAPPVAQAGSGFLDPNNASREELLTVAGMTPAAADALIQGRPYVDMLAVDRVLAASGMDEAGREGVYAGLWSPLDLNAASEEEILLIPGVGSRMQHEFEEYRPYRGMEEFRREIGKYVDEAEVARLERYVAIR